MPTYDYDCAACGIALEIFQSMSEAPKRKCPECGALKLKRRIGTGAGILFRGSGFYETDYRSDSYKQAAKADAPPGESKGESKPESKPESKGDSKAKPESGGTGAEGKGSKSRSPGPASKPKPGGSGASPSADQR